jgi:hypothetical protein
MKLPLQYAVSTAMLVATAGLATAGPDPPNLYYMVNPDTGESRQVDPGDVDLTPPGGDQRADDPVDTYDSLNGQDADGDGANFAGEYTFNGVLEDDYQMGSSVQIPQILYRHAFRAGFSGDDGADGRLMVTFLDDTGQNEVSSYLVNLTGNQGFNTINVFFDGGNGPELLPTGRVRFEWMSDQIDAEYGLMEDEPQLGDNDHQTLIHNGFFVEVDDLNPPAYGGVSMLMATTNIPTPGSLAPVALAGFGLLTARRRR